MPQVDVHTSPFGETADGVAVTRFDLVASDGSHLSLLDYGAVVLEVHVPDREGALSNVILGHPTLAAYERNDAYFGAFVGRTAGRLDTKPFTLGRRTVTLPANEGRLHLHGGLGGFHARSYAAEVTEQGGEVAEVTLRRTSPDGEEGYPGALRTEVRIRWSVDHVFGFEVVATTDAPTLVSTTHHGAWNLAGEGAGDVLGHDLRVPADAYLETRRDMLVTGTFHPVEGTPLDLREGVLLAGVVPGGGRLLAADGALDAVRSLQRCEGIDHAFVLPPAPPEWLREAAVLVDPASGRRLRVATTEPVLQVYTGNHLDGSLVGRQGKPLGKYGGVALEPQRFPNSVQGMHVPSALLDVGEVYAMTTTYAFDVV